jgi:hypothetical protein
VYILIACSSKNLCGIAQLDVGYVTVCSTKRTIRVLWHSVARHGCSGTLQVIKRQHTKATYPCYISTIEATYQRCISARYFRSLSGQSHLGKLFKRRTFMVDICK